MDRIFNITLKKRGLLLKIDKTNIIYLITLKQSISRLRLLVF